MNDILYLNKCIEIIEDKLNWGKSNDWTHSHFVRLAKLIADGSGINVDPHKLRKLFGKDNYFLLEVNPHKRAKDALAVFLGFKDWEDFIEKHSDITMIDDSFTNEDAEIFDVMDTPSRESQPFPKGLTLVLSFILLIIILLIVYLISSSNKKINITAKKIEGEAYSFSFNYDLSKVNSGDVKLYFDDNTYEVLDPTSNSSMHSYLYPSFYKPYIAFNDKVAGSATIHIKTRGWVGIVPGGGFGQVKRHRGVMFLSSHEIKNMNLPRNTKSFTLDYRNIRDFGIRGERLMAETRVKHESQVADCLFTEFKILCERGELSLRLDDSHCARSILFSCGEGKVKSSVEGSHLLTGKDFVSWQNIKISTDNKNAQLLINGHKVLETEIKKELGMVKGIVYRFKDSAAVDFIRLYNDKDEIVYKEEFDSK